MGKLMVRGISTHEESKGEWKHGYLINETSEGKSNSFCPWGFYFCVLAQRYNKKTLKNNHKIVDKRRCEVYNIIIIKIKLGRTNHGIKSKRIIR